MRDAMILGAQTNPLTAERTMRTARQLISVTAILGLGFLLSAQGCGSGNGGSNVFGGNSSGNPFGSSSGSNGSSGSGFGSSNGGSGTGSSGSGMCTGGNLCNQIHSCPAGSNPPSTTISGTIYDPAGKNPLYDVVAYIPNQMPSAITPGASCYSCADLYTGNPVAAALTGPDGKFTIQNAPDGANIPLVIQIGKWRRQFMLQNVAQCQNTAIPDKMLTLPKNQSEGDIPAIGIATGAADSMECLLTRIGVDQAEYGGGAGGSGRIHIFKGVNSGTTFAGANTNPPGPVASQGMWDTQADLTKFDIAILSCEGNDTTEMQQQALFDYAKNGGRVFASHFHYAWFNTGPFSTFNLAQWRTGANPMTSGTNIIGGVIQTTLSNGQAFPKGQALAQWLANVNALGVPAAPGGPSAPAGELPIEEAKHNADVTAQNVPSTVWIVADQNANPAGATQYFSFDTPLDQPANMQCGRVVYTDLHVGSAAADYNGTVDGMHSITNYYCPTDCTTGDLTPQEKALEFMLFDLSACVTPTNQTPTAPPVGPIQ
jgi:hypothetical protein